MVNTFKWKTTDLWGCWSLKCSYRRSLYLFGVVFSARWAWKYFCYWRCHCFLSHHLHRCFPCIIMKYQIYAENRKCTQLLYASCLPCVWGVPTLNGALIGCCWVTVLSSSTGKLTTGNSCTCFTSFWQRVVKDSKLPCGASTFSTTIFRLLFGL